MVIFSTHTCYVRWYQSVVLQPDPIAGDNSAESGHAYDEDQGVEVLRVRLLTQEMALRALVDNIDHRFQAFEWRFDEIIDRLDALAIGANRNRNDDRRWPRDDFARGQFVNKPIPAHHRRQLIYSDDSEEEEDFLFCNNQPAKGGGRYGQDYERDGGDFRLKVNIPFFSGNLNIL